MPSLFKHGARQQLVLTRPTLAKLTSREIRQAPSGANVLNRIQWGPPCAWPYMRMVQPVQLPRHPNSPTFRTRARHMYGRHTCLGVASIRIRIRLDNQAHLGTARAEVQAVQRRHIGSEGRGSHATATVTPLRTQPDLPRAAFRVPTCPQADPQISSTAAGGHVAIRRQSACTLAAERGGDAPEEGLLSGATCRPTGKIHKRGRDSLLIAAWLCNGCAAPLLSSGGVTSGYTNHGLRRRLPEAVSSANCVAQPLLTLLAMIAAATLLPNSRCAHSICACDDIPLRYGV